jgi:predicted metal-dependent phosphotriesterase family hydrolase
VDARQTPSPELSEAKAASGIDTLIDLDDPGPGRDVAFARDVVRSLRVQ